MPGPGAYDDDYKVSKTRGSQAFLGTGQRSNFTSSTARNPGPGTYDKNVNYEDIPK
jgi:hypothetical protein